MPCKDCLKCPKCKGTLHIEEGHDKGDFYFECLDCDSYWGEI